MRECETPYQARMTLRKVARHRHQAERSALAAEPVGRRAGKLAAAHAPQASSAGIALHA
jgi:hypothetical protein